MATEDILISDGDSFISLSALAAEQVDVTLPIESVNGTVKLDSPSANTFTVSTGGVERVKVDGDGFVAIGSNTQAGRQLKVQYKVDGDETVAVGMYSTINVPTDQSVNTAFGHQLQQFGGGKVNTKAVGYYVSDTGLHSSAPKRYGIEISVDAAEGTYAIWSVGTAPSRLNGILEANAGVQTSSVSGLADNDASIALGAELLTSNHTPTKPNSIATKKYTDDADVMLQNNINQKAEIWVGSTEEYLALGIYNNQTLYCITN